jgi:hypothetical protein
VTIKIAAGNANVRHMLIGHPPRAHCIRLSGKSCGGAFRAQLRSSPPAVPPLPIDYTESTTYWVICFTMSLSTRSAPDLRRALWDDSPRIWHQTRSQRRSPPAWPLAVPGIARGCWNLSPRICQTAASRANGTTYDRRSLGCIVVALLNNHALAPSQLPYGGAHMMPD